MATKKGSTKKASSKKQARGSGKRELLKPGKAKFYGKRGPGGKFSEMDEVGPSLRVDRRQSAKKKVKPGFGDQGDQPKRKSSKKPSSKKR